MEIIGKGNYEKGAVWVARKIPQGYVSAHANQARITTFPLDSPDECLYSPDVVSFAKDIGLYPKDSPDSEFSFSDIYDAVTFSGARFCDARVWSFFGDIMGEEWADQYLDYAMGVNLTNRMPLWVSPPSKVSASDVMGHMRNHYENTKLSMDGLQFPDVGASFDSVPVRAHPLTWTASNNVEYLNERPIATQQTGWNFVSQSRSWMPTELSGLMWFGVDDSATTVRFPIYGSATRVPLAFAGKGAQDGVTPPVMEFDDERAFDIFNLVANWVYLCWDYMYPELKETIENLEVIYKEKVN
jgi:dipeptidase